MLLCFCSIANCLSSTNIRIMSPKSENCFTSLFLSSCSSILILLVVDFSANAQVSITTVSPKTAHAVRCRDTQIPNPYARGFIEWTSQTSGPNPPIPVVTTTTSIDRFDSSTGIYRQMSSNTRYLTAFNSKFSTEAKSNVNTGQFKGYSTFYINTTTGQQLPPLFDLAVCN